MHVILRIQPDRYVHPHHCEADILVHRHPTIRAQLSRPQLRAVLSDIRTHHGRDVSIRRHRRWRFAEADLVLAYSQHRLITSEAVIAFEEWIENLVHKAFAERVRTI